MNITPENITHLKHDEIFVFGANLLGIHGKGDALSAYKKFGAKRGICYGFTGQCFAIPTKDAYLNRLSLDIIRDYVNMFHKIVIQNLNLNFLITKIGCGLAGYSPKEIAPMFEKFLNLKNVSLPQEFLENLCVNPCKNDF